MQSASAGLGKPVPQAKLDEWIERWNASPPITFKTQPYRHQLEALVSSAKLPAFALFMEMGTGKSWIAIQNIAYLWTKRLISQAVVVAPNGVHVQWAREQIPEHMPLSVPYKTYVWKQRFEAAIDQHDPSMLQILCCNVEAFSTVRSAERLAAHIREDSILVVDESSRIKSPDARRTQLLTQIAHQVKFRRILTGTPITRQLDDLWAQFYFLDPKILGLQSQHAFRAHYCVSVPRRVTYRVYNKQTHRYEERSKTIQLVIGVKNADLLRERLRRYVYRVTKEQCLDLPNKIYMTRYVALSDEQREAYNAVLAELRVQFHDRNIDLQINTVLTQLLRLQQICSGWLPDTSGQIKPLANDRIATLEECLEELDTGKVIIWSRFVHDIELMLERFGPQAVGFYGACSSEERAANIEAFRKDPNVRYLIGNPQVGGLGLNLTVASTMIYYNQDWALETRLQSEDRIHRIGQDHHCTYIDFIAPGTVDELILRALRRKQALASMTLDDLKATIESLEEV
jgi:SNF2 family DNA or RNA helicase